MIMALTGIYLGILDINSIYAMVLLMGFSWIAGLGILLGFGSIPKHLYL